MHKYGATSEHLAHVAITQRKHAQNNPNAAMYGKPMTMDDYMNSRMVCEPLRLFDCQEDDGGACSSRPRAGEGHETSRQ